MTKISIFKANNQITGFRCEGHSGYAESGQDIVCASVSALVGACHLGLQKILGIDVDFNIDEKKGYFFLQLPQNQIENPKAQVLLQTLEQSLMELAEQYKKHLKIKIGG